MSNVPQINNERITVDLPASLAWHLRVTAAERGVKIKTLVADSLKSFIGTPTGKPGSKSRQ